MHDDPRVSSFLRLHGSVHVFDARAGYGLELRDDVCGLGRRRTLFFLLIGYYFNRQEAANASRKAFITNRIGDFGFILAIFGVIATFGTAQYTSVISQAADIRWNRSAIGA